MVHLQAGRLAAVREVEDQGRLGAGPAGEVGAVRVGKAAGPGGGEVVAAAATAGVDQHLVPAA